MASSSQRRQRDLMAVKDSEEQESGLFSDIEIDQGTEAQDFLEVTGLSKSPLYLLLCIRSPNFPLFAGDTLYVNVSKIKQGGAPNEILILENGYLQTNQGTHRSLSLAAKDYLENKTKVSGKSKYPDAWEAVKIANRARPGVFNSLNILFEKNWQSIGAPVSVLQDEKMLGQYMIENGLATPDEVTDMSMPVASKKLQKA